MDRRCRLEFTDKWTIRAPAGLMAADLRYKIDLIDTKIGLLSFLSISQVTVGSGGASLTFQRQMSQVVK